MRIEIFAILVCFFFFTAFAAVFLVVKCVQKKARKMSGRVEDEEENENAYNTTVYEQISASEDESAEESEEEEDIWNDWKIFFFMKWRCNKIAKADNIIVNKMTTVGIEFSRLYPLVYPLTFTTKIYKKKCFSFVIEFIYKNVLYSEI